MGNILAISNQKSKRYFQRLLDVYEQDSELISSEADLYAFFKTKDLEEVELCFVQASLVWNKRSALQFYGFDIIKKLRKRGLRCVVQIITLFDTSHFDFKFPRHALLKVPDYHQLLKLPISKKDLSALPLRKMSRELLNDIKDSLLDIPSILHEILHDLKNQLSSEKKELIEDVKAEIEEKTHRSFEGLVTLLPDKKSQLYQIKNELIKNCLNLPQVNFQERIQMVLENVTNQITALAPAYEQIEGAHRLPETRWKVLFIDDDQNIRSILKKGLSRNNISCQIAVNAEEVFQFLEEDKKQNRITILICDVRLINHETNEWQPLQGYDIIKKVQDHYPNQLAYFVLTSGRSRLLRITETYKANVYAHYKRDVINSAGGINLFSNKIREIGEQVFFASRSQPNLAAWRKETQRFYKPHSFFYKTHLIDTEYGQAEDAINAEATAFIANLMEGRANEKKEWTITITPPKAGEDKGMALKKFREHILLGRRIALGLYVNGFTEEQILDHMHDQAKVTNQDAIKKLLLNTTFALSFRSDFPSAEDLRKGHYLKSNLLLEEIEWLIKAYQTDFDFKEVRLNHEDWTSLSLIIENLQHRIREIEQTPQAQTSKAYEALLKLNLNRLSVKNIPAYFKTAHKTAEAYQLTSSFREDIQLDLDEFHNPKIKPLLSQFL